MRPLITIVVLAMTAGAGALAQETTQPPSSTPTIKIELQLCTSVTDHTPSGVGTSFPAEVGAVCCWNRVFGASDNTTIKHVWLYNGKTMAVVDLPVRSYPWRTHSKKKILPQWTGQWEVKVTDGAGNELAEATFTIGADSATSQ